MVPPPFGTAPALGTASERGRTAPAGGSGAAGMGRPPPSRSDGAWPGRAPTWLAPPRAGLEE